MAHEKVYGFCESKCKVEVPSLEKHNQDISEILQFTYIVDSDQKLLDWANNVEGNDFTSVLIKKGTWTNSVGVNLTTAGTKVVVGEAGSKLVFNEVKYGLFYTTRPKTPEYYMNGVNVEARITDGEINEGTYTSVCCGFYNCYNLTNCVSYTEGGGGVRDGVFYSSGYCASFSQCENLTSCKGDGMNNADGDDSEEFGCGFLDCINLNSCLGSGYKMFGSFRYGYGFLRCNLVSKCKASGMSSTSVFGSCYASNANNSTYAVADTANGGFNNTTNS